MRGGLWLLCLMMLECVMSVPLSLMATSKHTEIPNRHDLPAPYHKTDDVLKFVQNLASSCSKPDRFKLEMRSVKQAMDLEMDLTPVKHGKSDDYFDYQLKHAQTLLQSNVELIHNNASPRKEADLPASWLDKSTPPADLPVLHVTMGNSGTKKPAFIMFGEHGRELISCEIGMSFLQAVHDVACTPGLDEVNLIQIEESEYSTNTPYSREQIHALLSEWDLHIMPIVSPSAREIAEKADFCNRKNANRVDVNRNYPFHFGEGNHEMSSEQFPGSKPLTEPETRVAAQLAREVHPRLFVSVHSGAEMIVTSPAYRQFDLEQMPVGIQKVVKGIQRADCPECTAGPASQVLSYLAYGCSMDYMFEQGFSEESDPSKPSEEHFSFTFETWAGDRERFATKDLDYSKLFGDNAGAVREQQHIFEGLKAKVGDGQYECLTRFNPPPALYPKMVNKWTKALFSTMHAVNKELDAKPVPTTNNNNNVEAKTSMPAVAPPSPPSVVPAVVALPAPDVATPLTPVAPPTPALTKSPPTVVKLVSAPATPSALASSNSSPDISRLVQTEAGMEHGLGKASEGASIPPIPSTPSLSRPMDQLMNAEASMGHEDLTVESMGEGFKIVKLS